MQIIKAVVIPVELSLRQPIQMAGIPMIRSIHAQFVRLETQKGRTAWGCGIADAQMTGEEPLMAIEKCQQAGEIVPDLHPTNLEYSLAALEPIIKDSPSATCAYNLALHDLLGIITGLPLYRLLGGYRNRIQTSVTIPIAPVSESVEIARGRAKAGFRMFKVKGGVDPAMDVERVQAIHRALPNHIIRLDADGNYDVKSALEVAKVLEGKIEMLEQPTPANDFEGLRQVTKNSPVPILADQSASDTDSVLRLAAHKSVNGISVKMAICGGITCARQMDTIARAANIVTMVSCLIEPALLISAGLSLALSSANVRYGDLDGNLELQDDPSLGGYNLEDGWLIASDVPGLGCHLDL